MTANIIDLLTSGVSDARKIAGKPALIALIDQDALAERTGAVERASRAAAKSRLLARRGVDLHALVADGLAADRDPEEIYNEAAAAQAAHTTGAATTALFEYQEAAERGRLSDLVVSSIPEMYEGLAASLPAILDRGAAALADLGSARTASEAITNEVVPGWQALTIAHREYSDLRDGHLALLRVEDPTNYRVDHDAIAWALYANPRALDRSLADVAAGGATYRQGPLDTQGTASRPDVQILDAVMDTFIAVLEYRDALRPHIADAATASASRADDVRAARHQTNGAPTSEYTTAYGESRGVDRAISAMR